MGRVANDFVGNDILFSYDNGIELDGSEGNARCFPESIYEYIQYFERVAHARSRLSVAQRGNQYRRRANEISCAGHYASGGAHVCDSLTSGAATANAGTSHYFEVENNIFVAQASSGQLVVGLWGQGESKNCLL